MKRKMTEISTSPIFFFFFFSLFLFSFLSLPSLSIPNTSRAKIPPTWWWSGWRGEGGGGLERAPLTRPHSLIPVTVMSTSRVPFARLCRLRRAPRSHPVYGLSNGLQTHYQQSRAALLGPPLHLSATSPVSAGFSGVRGVGAPCGSLCVWFCFAVSRLCKAGRVRACVRSGCAKGAANLPLHSGTFLKN